MLDTVNENHLIDWKLYDDEGKREGSIEIACQNPVKEDCATSEFSEAPPKPSKCQVFFLFGASMSLSLAFKNELRGPYKIVSMYLLNFRRRVDLI